MSFESIRRLFTPHKTVPITPWRAAHRWDLSPIRVLILSFGLIIFGLGDSLLVQADIGNAPWTVLSQGLTKKIDISIGVATLIISIFVLLIWIPLKEKPGFGTLANILLIASSIQVGTMIFPKQNSLIFGIIFDLIGISMVGLGSALYLTCGLGAGPRDGAMTGIHYKTGIRVGRVRLGIEVVVLIIGGLMGGRVGIGTALFALLIGQSVAIFLGVVARLTQP